MRSEARVLREKRRCAGVLSISSDGVFRKSSRDKCGSWLATTAFFKIYVSIFTSVILSLPVGLRIPRQDEIRQDNLITFLDIQYYSIDRPGTAGS